jgi:glycosyltransferase involved in cell wall biosynthesis
MRIAIVANGLSYSDDYPSPSQGGSVQTWNLAKDLVKRGHEITILRRGKSSRKDEAGINLTGIDFRGLEDFFIFQSTLFHIGSFVSRLLFSRQVYKVLQKKHPDLIIFIDRLTGLFCLKLATPKIYVMHSPDALNLYREKAIRANPLNLIGHQIKHRVESHIISRTNAIVVLNKYVKRHLEMSGVEHVFCIPNAIETYEKNGKRDDRNFVLYGGRLDWNKNVESLVLQFAQLTNRYPDFKLVIVGTGPRLRVIKELISHHNLNSHAEVYPSLPRHRYLEIVKLCSFFVLPSTFELSPVSLIEAMGFGKPIVAKENIGTQDMVKHNDTGFLYKSDRELANYMSMLISDANLRREMGNRAKLLVEREYSTNKQTNRYEILFSMIVRHC